MRVTAGILGIIGGILFLLIPLILNSGLNLLGASGGAVTFFKIVAWAVPLCGIIGGALTFSRPLVGGILMLISAALVLYVTLNGTGFGQLTTVPILCTGIGGLLALLAAARRRRSVSAIDR